MDPFISALLVVSSPWIVCCSLLFIYGVINALVVIPVWSVIRFIFGIN